MMRPTRTILSRSILLAPLVTAVACVLPDRDLGSLADESSGSDGTSVGGSSDGGLDGRTATSADAGTSDGDGDGDGDGDDGRIPTECVSDDVVPIECEEDPDHDEVRLACDNEPDYFNPDQGDIDGDGVGDVVDLCPTVESSPTNSADSDKDGVGNECDTCRMTTQQYNAAEGVAIDPRLLVRNIPSQIDSDEDGIGDACDNCVTVANCEDFGPGNPFEVGDPIAYDDRNACQGDDALDGVGDACEGMQAADAAGPIGLGQSDDFDQDGLANAIDVCPRQPVDRVECTSDVGCGPGRNCELAIGQCNHLDSDGDLVGDLCDTCALVPNPAQVTEGGQQEDDPDGDFVGTACETHVDCSDGRSDARPLAFFEVSANGDCCSVQLIADPDTLDLLNAVTGQPLRDPDGLPVRVDCVEPDDPEARTCRRLPDAVASRPGVLTPPPGCDAALAAAGYTAVTNPRLGPEDAPSLDGLWNRMCLLPQFDQDYDGVGDPCDLCPLSFDPGNEMYIDEGGKLWPNDGRYCNGEYDVESICMR